MIVSASGGVRIWDAATGARVGESPTAGDPGYPGWVCAVALGRIGDRDVIVSGGADATVRIWDAGTGARIGEPLTGHAGWVNAVALGRIGNRDVIVSGGEDRTVRIWDAGTGQCETVLDLLGPASACALGPSGLLCVATGLAVCTFALSP